MTRAVNHPTKTRTKGTGRKSCSKSGWEHAVIPGTTFSRCDLILTFQPYPSMPPSAVRRPVYFLSFFRRISLSFQHYTQGVLQTRLSLNYIFKPNDRSNSTNPTTASPSSSRSSKWEISKAARSSKSSIKNSLSMNVTP